MADLYEGINEPSNALRYIKKAHALQDSLFSIKKEQQYDELRLMYETEKKDAEIALLNKDVELSVTRQQRLWGGIGLLSILALSIFYTQSRLRSQERTIAAKEKTAEVENRKRIEQELEFKQKELTAKALQLASKNEFLHNLEDEINSLKSSVDQKVHKTTKKISRMIHNDALDDEEWSHFSKEFSSLHESFIHQMKEKHGDFTNNEWRLISLMKMNLSSKDIANILRISSEGVKKARYRLRKKLQIDSSIPLQDYVLSV